MSHFNYYYLFKGFAAFNVYGQTLHSLFQLAVPTPKKDPAPELTGDQLDKLQTELADTEIIVIGKYFFQ